MDPLTILSLQPMSLQIDDDLSSLQHLTFAPAPVFCSPRLSRKDSDYLVLTTPIFTAEFLESQYPSILPFLFGVPGASAPTPAPVFTPCAALAAAIQSGKAVIYCRDSFSPCEKSSITPLSPPTPTPKSPSFVLYPGSFNPPHHGHLAVAAAAKACSCVDLVVPAIAIGSCDKPSMSHFDLYRRLCCLLRVPNWSFVAVHDLKLMVDQSNALGGSIDIVCGVDTAIRILDPRWYAGGEAGRASMFRELVRLQTRILVAPRETTDWAKGGASDDCQATLLTCDDLERVAGVDVDYSEAGVSRNDVFVGLPAAAAVAASSSRIRGDLQREYEQRVWV